ncbi:BQ5605_C003g02530 [Microbotryum silenes-dioicae]|uniref:BQ5605_C003g02530 protein n=1 Tax=Microbotryum silenes-dioicae TaxID=796604 RepID=A0A2X0P4H4_9BASI|nr:BQ5605_C003g02530 [Microbotryum silenes-dioicae]
MPCYSKGALFRAKISEGNWAKRADNSQAPPKGRGVELTLERAQLLIDIDRDRRARAVDLHFCTFVEHKATSSNSTEEGTVTISG